MLALRRMPDIELGIVAEDGAVVEEVHVPVPASEAQQRFKAAVQKVKGGRNIRRMSQVVDAVWIRAPADRFAAVVEIEREVAHEEPALQSALVKAIRKKKEGTFDGFADRTVTELYITSSQTFHLLTPRKLGNHRRWVTWVLALVIIVTFWYMAGAFPAYLAAGGSISAQCLAQPAVTNAGGMWQWIGPDSDFCISHTFSADYLIRWGALWLPQLRAQPWRLWSSLVVHQTVWHMVTNLMLWLLLAAYVEKTFGWWRLLILWFLAGTGGALMTGCFDKACVANVGFSGADFGLLGVFVVDLAENIRVSKRAVLRSVLTVILACAAHHRVSDSSQCIAICSPGRLPVAAFFPV